MARASGLASTSVTSVDASEKRAAYSSSAPTSPPLRHDRAGEAEDRFAHVHVDGARGRRELGELLPGPMGVPRGEQLLDRLGLRVHVSEDLREAVVHFVRDPVALSPDGELT